MKNVNEVARDYATKCHTESSINNCLSKRSKSAGGYKWMYKNSINN